VCGFDPTAIDCAGACHGFVACHPDLGENYDSCVAECEAQLEHAEASCDSLVMYGCYSLYGADPCDLTPCEPCLESNVCG
jgi:hypothetical protein